MTTTDRRPTASFPATIVAIAWSDESGEAFPGGEAEVTFRVPADVIVAAGDYTITRSAR